MFKLAGVALATVTLTQALALPNSNPAPSGLAQNARFDNDPGLPVLDVGPINIYLDIFWKGMALVETEASSDPDMLGVIPNSPDNLASFGVTEDPTIIQGTPQMTTVYDDSTVKNFTLGPFFYGCAVNTFESAADIPVSCTMTLTGYNSNGKVVAQQSFQFVMDGLSQQMVEAKPYGFTQVQFVTFQISGANATTSGLIETVQYIVYGP